MKKNFVFKVAECCNCKPPLKYQGEQFSFQFFLSPTSPLPPVSESSDSLWQHSDRDDFRLIPTNKKRLSSRRTSVTYLSLVFGEFANWRKKKKNALHVCDKSAPIAGGVVLQEGNSTFGRVIEYFLGIFNGNVWLVQRATTVYRAIKIH